MYFSLPNKLPEKYPPSPPPDVVPQYCPNFHIATPTILKNCLNRYMYVWLYIGDTFWFFPLELDQHFVSGHIWTGNRWIVRRFSWRLIDCFY